MRNVDSETFNATTVVLASTVADRDAEASSADISPMQVPSTRDPTNRSLTRTFDSPAIRK